MIGRRPWFFALLAVAVVAAGSLTWGYQRTYVRGDYRISLEVPCDGEASCFAPYEEGGDPFAVLITSASSLRARCGTDVASCTPTCDSLGPSCSYLHCGTDEGAQYGDCLGAEEPEPAEGEAAGEGVTEEVTEGTGEEAPSEVANPELAS